MMENTIVVDTVDYGGPNRSTCTPDIVLCKIQKVKNHEGGYDKKAKNSKKSIRNIKNSDAPTLKLATNGIDFLEMNLGHISVQLIFRRT